MYALLKRLQVIEARVLSNHILITQGVGSRQTSEYYDLPPSIQMFLAEYTRMTKQGFVRLFGITSV